jgi:hypothetical protein
MVGLRKNVAECIEDSVTQMRRIFSEKELPSHFRRHTVLAARGSSRSKVDLGSTTRRRSRLDITEGSGSANSHSLSCSLLRLSGRWPIGCVFDIGLRSRAKWLMGRSRNLLPCDNDIRMSRDGDFVMRQKTCECACFWLTGWRNLWISRIPE